MNSHEGLTATLPNKYEPEKPRELHRTRHGWQMKRQVTTHCQDLNNAVGEYFGKRVKEERKKRNWTMEEFCRRAGLVTATPKNRTYEIEHNTRKGSVKMGTLYAIAAAFGIEPAELLPPVAVAMQSAGVTEQTFKTVGKTN